MQRTALVCFALSGGLPVVAPVWADVTRGIDADAMLPYWELSEPGMSLRLVQRLPDQTRGFFLARGLPREAVERVAGRCVFQTVFKNRAGGSDQRGAIEYDLREWIVESKGAPAGMKTREDWAEEWARLDVPKHARIAFEWALFPTRQTYNPGDYNWGMSIFDLPPGTRFDLKVHWRQYGRVQSATIEGLHCAPDEPYKPEAP